MSDWKKLLDWIADVGINGFGFLPSAEEVAKHYLAESNDNTEEAINSIIRWKTAHGAGTGFITGVGGFAFLPVAIPASLASSYAIGANAAAAIAVLRGYDIYSDKVRTFVLLSLLGESFEKTLKSAGIKIGGKLGQKVLEKIPGKVFIEINKKVGFRLVTKAGEKGVINIIKFIPLIGGGVGAAFDSTFVNTCGKTAKKIFIRSCN